MTLKQEKYLELAFAPEIEGLRFRLFQEESDYEEMARVSNAANLADGVREASSGNQIAHFYQYCENADANQDILLAEINGKLVGYGEVSWEDEQDGPRVYFLSGMVDPDWRRNGLGSAMMAYNEKRLRTIASGHPKDREKALHGFVADTSIAGNLLFKKEGYDAIRFFFLMIRDLKAPIAEAKMPSNLELRPVRKNQFRQIYEAMDEAFQDHWGYIASTDARYDRWQKHPLNDESLWKVAWDGDEVAGMILNVVNADENKKLGLRWGWPDPICVRRGWRKRGLATALILESLNMLKDRGFEQAVLHVDTQNANGALGLYESNGFKIEEQTNDYRKVMELE